MAIEDAKSDEYYKAADRIVVHLIKLGEQHLEAQQAEWVHSTEEYKDLYMLREYANKACQRTGAHTSIPGEEFNHHFSHPNQSTTVNLADLMPYLDDYIICRHHPFVEDFIWSMDDSRHTESISKELTEADVSQLHIFADRATINAARSAASNAAAEVAKRDSSRAVLYSSHEIKRNRQGLREKELSSSEALDITVLKLGDPARQMIQHQADVRMLRLIMNQTSRIMMLAEGASLAVNQWGKNSDDRIGLL